jgi:hypothetical protein
MYDVQSYILLNFLNLNVIVVRRRRVIGDYGGYRRLIVYCILYISQCLEGKDLPDTVAFRGGCLGL